MCKKYVIKILGLKKLYSWMLWKTESKVLVWHKILLKRLRLCLWKIWSANLEIQSKDLDLKMAHVLNFSADLNLVFAESFVRFIWSNIMQKSPFLFQDLKLKLYWLAVNLPVYFSGKWNLMTYVAKQFVCLLSNDDEVLSFLMRCYLKRHKL